MEKAHLIKIIICVFMACIPAYIWGYIFYKKQPEPRKLVALTFILGVLSVTPILLYKYSWKFFPAINAFLYTNSFQNHHLQLGDFLSIPLSVIMTFMLVGVVEEYMKHVVVKIADQDKFKCINDAIEYSVIAALGFAFLENILYFLYIWKVQGIDTLFMSFVFRSIFSTFAHILFSGMYGYYYGIAVFSDPIYQEEIKNGRHFIITLMHRIIHLKSSTIFKEEKVVEGLLVAVSLHAFFNIMLEMNWTYLMVPYLMLGYLILDYLFKKKEDLRVYEKVV